MTDTKEEKLSIQDFTQRFVDHMIKVVGFEYFDDGSSVREYAEGIADSYYNDETIICDHSPEECAETDVSYWED